MHNARPSGKLGIAKKRGIFGFRDGVEKFQIIKSARVVVYPAVFEVGGNAPAEALCCGLPGVSFDLPPLRRYYRAAGQAPPGDFPGLADAFIAWSPIPTLRETSKEALAAGLEWELEHARRRHLESD